MKILLVMLLTFLFCTGFAGKKSDEKIWVAKPDGSLGCLKNSGQTVEAGANELRGAGVETFESKKQGDGKIRAQVCHIPTGQMNWYLIKRADLEKATAKNYLEAPKVPTE